ncbi:MAG: serine hydrolase [Bacteroidales bacterium]
MKSQVTRMFLALFFLGFWLTSHAQPLTGEQIGQLVERTLKAFDVPGIAVGIVKDGQVVHARGYGVRSLRTGKPVDEHTLFGIASNSKAFTAAALGILVEEGKLGWNDKVVDHIPEFRLYDPYVTQDFTIRDLLTHRSGMGLGAGDLMIWPDGNDFTRQEIIHNLRYLKQVSPFRSKYDYDNNLYIVAGEVIGRVSGTSWEDFVETRILKPLGMSQTGSCFNRLRDTSNVIDAHCPVEGQVQVIDRTRGELMNAAGGIYSNINDLSKWVNMLLARGTFGLDGQERLLNRATVSELWTPHTFMGARTSIPYNTHFTAYGLGFVLADVKGYLEVSHTGGLAGMVTQITLYPELNLGIIVLTNQEVGAAFTAIANQIKDGYLGISGVDWVTNLEERMKSRTGQADRVVEATWAGVEHQRAAGFPNQPAVDLLTGTYKDPWFGNVSVYESDGQLRITSERSPKLTGELHHYKGYTFVAKWADRSLNADALVLFQPGFDGQAEVVRMKALSPLTDFSYDFHDLELTRTGSNLSNLD